ncbi:hypothetical protein B0T17DRAFT_590236 [Bombardia bombarda]|uniref:Uncharacterized protein n=1 Tax=Bombardia bombarda TaxID=252184 RepID=A0AA40CA77_9PEZI|nr:hypothetical protein B0T17DRAFT_590236 [Bombardia bombarda]
MVMATAQRRGTALRISGLASLVRALILTVLTLPSLLTTGIANALCGASFLFPTQGLQFYYLDTINVTYLSSFSDPILSLSCGQPGQAAIKKFEVNHATPFDASVLVYINFLSNDPCWFSLVRDRATCEDTTDSFVLVPRERSLDSTPTTIGLLSSTAAVIPTSTSTTSSLSSTPTAVLATATSEVVVDTVGSEDPSHGGDHLGLGAKIGLGIGIALTCIIASAMAAFLFLRRRRRHHQDSALAGAIIDHDRRHGRKGPEKPPSRTLSSSVTSGGSQEPLTHLQPIQPVFDGFPGSMGYDDVRSIHSSTYPHSPAGPHSPTLSNNGGFWGSERSSGRDELSAARLHSQPMIPTSYGPNPVTPTLTPRPSSRVELNVRAGLVSRSSREEIAAMPAIMPDYISYSIPPPEAFRDPSPSPPRKAAPPIVVSYGPNRVTPTPAVTTPTVPPDDAIVKRQTEAVAQHNTSHDRRYSWDADEPMMPSTMGPLPPYASMDDFNAMEKGAIRKLAEPQAQAELPPTKDGFYHYASDFVEYELPGAAPEHEPQLPFQPHPYKRHPTAGPSGGNGWREIDEQKFLLSDVEMAKLREQKMKVRAAMKEESYNLGDPSSSTR